MYQLRITPTAQKHLKRIEIRYQQLIVKAIDELQHSPRIGYPLKGVLKGWWKLRVANYRIIYEIVDQQLMIIIIDIDHRKQVYK